MYKSQEGITCQTATWNSEVIYRQQRLTLVMANTYNIIQPTDKLTHRLFTTEFHITLDKIGTVPTCSRYSASTPECYVKGKRCGL